MSWDKSLQSLITAERAELRKNLKRKDISPASRAAVVKNNREHIAKYVKELREYRAREARIKKLDRKIAKMK